MHDASQPAEAGPPATGSWNEPVAVPEKRLGRTGAAVAVPVVCLALILALRLWLEYVGPFPGDRWALGRNDYGGQSRAILDLGNLFQVIGTPVPALITIAWAAAFVGRAEGRRGVLFLLVASLGVVFNSILKALSGPTPLMDARNSDALNYPSGHTAYAVVVFGSLAWMAWRRRRVDIAAALVFLIVLMGPLRVTLGAHFVSDVVAAYLAGLAWLVPVAILTGYGPSRAAPTA